MIATRSITNQVLNQLLEQVRDGCFAVKYHDGATKRYGSGEPQFTVRFNDNQVLDSVGEDMLTTFGEAYMDGRVDVEGDLADLVSLALRSGSLSRFTQKTQGFAGAALRAVGARRSLRREQDNIARHYDLGNDFFRLWLDESLTYSCAYFRSPSDTLEGAQRQKIEHTLQKLRLRPNETLLDIGCGWGSLVMRASEKYQVRATGITLSEEQHAGANAAIGQRGLQETAHVRLANYSALPREGVQFDKIVSVGMIEHVGAMHYHEYFAKTHELLADGGIMLTHTIGRAGPPGRTDKWTRKYIFPGGFVPSLSHLVDALEHTGWAVSDFEELRYHYALTLAEWYRRTTMHEAEITALYDARMFRMWQFYLAGFESSFRYGELVNFHIQSVKRRDAVPMTRDYISAETARLSALDADPVWHLERKAAE